MRKVLLLAIAVTLLVSSAALPCGCSDDKKGTNKNKPAKKENTNTKAKSNQNQGAQSFCPIDNNSEINKDIYTVYQGKKVYFCCKKCKDKFQNSPQKYIESLLEKGVSLENNTGGKKFTDPVSGKKVRPNKYSTYYEGQFYYFSSERTIDRFRQQPDKYLGESNKKQK